MEKNKNRPIYLNILRIRLPVGGVLSIVHRVTGAVLVLSLPFGLYLLDRSLHDPDAFREIASRLSSLDSRLFTLIMVWVFTQHFISGIRHLLLDIGLGEAKSTARMSAWLSFAISGVMALIVGAFLWNA